ncbi:MAG: hypothetical protein IJS61_00335 [Firmicutes bacterium]|nr:hypothetical protein [Bacillota bacterium]
MAVKYIDRKFYEAIINFDDSEEARDYYYSVMDKVTSKTDGNKKEDTIRNKILRTYAMLFCEGSVPPGQEADCDDVAQTADRLYIGSAGFDPTHWYRMRYHFPVIDDDNYDRFAALVIADLNAGPLREAAMNEGNTLLVGEKNPFMMTGEERKSQKLRSVGSIE